MTPPTDPESPLETTSATEPAGAPPAPPLLGAEVTTTTADRLPDRIASSILAGGRFVNLAASMQAAGHATLEVMVADGPTLRWIGAPLVDGVTEFPSLTPVVPAADWYERVVHETTRLTPVGHPSLRPLLTTPAPEGPPADLTRAFGEGLFALPYGPVRSGVFESIGYLLETVGEDIPFLQVHPHYKHRGVEAAMAGRTVEDGVLVAERVEGATSVAHALAYCLALEQLAGVAVPPAAQLLRVVHAELERIAHHLQSMVRHCEAAGQAVAYARLSGHLEAIMRLRARLGGHRFGRGVVVPGGVAGPPLLEPARAADRLTEIARALTPDLELLMATPSFLDRLRGAGRLPTEVARAHGAVGPVGRGSGVATDVRVDAPYDGYRLLPPVHLAGDDSGDALGRQRVRLLELRRALAMAHGGLLELARSPKSPHAPGTEAHRDSTTDPSDPPSGPGEWRSPLADADGRSVARVEAPSGELVYLIEVAAGQLTRVRIRTASFHNQALFPLAFRGDIFTDFAFIEASFGLQPAGVAL